MYATSMGCHWMSYRSDISPSLYSALGLCVGAMQGPDPGGLRGQGPNWYPNQGRSSVSFPGAPQVATGASWGVFTEYGPPAPTEPSPPFFGGPHAAPASMWDAGVPGQPALQPYFGEAPQSIAGTGWAPHEWQVPMVFPQAAPGLAWARGIAPSRAWPGRVDAFASDWRPSADAHLSQSSAVEPVGKEGPDLSQACAGEAVDKEAVVILWDLNSYYFHYALLLEELYQYDFEVVKYIKVDSTTWGLVMDDEYSQAACLVMCLDKSRHLRVRDGAAAIRAALWEPNGPQGVNKEIPALSDEFHKEWERHCEEKKRLRETASPVVCAPMGR